VASISDHTDRVAEAVADGGDIKLGVCGEHGGDPDSIDFFHHYGIDYVSCSPYRVPVARVAAAQAAVRAASLRQDVSRSPQKSPESQQVRLRPSLARL
jgi:phosphoenolpyruvate-protein kinase (PTS system EI component)